jgi:hypothetical protein
VVKKWTDRHSLLVFNQTYRQQRLSVFPQNRELQMASIKRKTVTRAIPEGATIKGNKVAWKLADGRKRTGSLVVRDDGKRLVRFKSDTWYAKFRDDQGVVREVSTGCRDKAVALTKLAEMCREVEKVRAGVLSQADLAAKNWIRKRIEVHIRDYLTHLKHQRGKGKRSRTSDAHLVDTERNLRRIVGDCKFSTLKAVSREKVEEWVSDCLLDEELEWSHRTINAHLASLKAFMNWAAPKRVPANPLDRFPMLDAEGNQKRPRRALTNEELARLLVVARLRPVAEYGREIEKTPKKDKRTGWKRLPLSFKSIRLAYESG